MLSQSQRFTALGLSSLLIWASLVGVVKLISEQLSPVLALALIYSVSALVILLHQGWPKLSQMPKIYLWGVGHYLSAMKFCSCCRLLYRHSANRC